MRLSADAIQTCQQLSRTFLEFGMFLQSRKPRWGYAEKTSEMPAKMRLVKKPQAAATSARDIAWPLWVISSRARLPSQFLEADLANEDYVDLLDDEFLHGLARKYGVSTQALVNRLKNLGYIQD